MVKNQLAESIGQKKGGVLNRRKSVRRKADCRNQSAKKRRKLIAEINF